MKKWLTVAIAAVIALPAYADGEVNVYSARKVNLIAPVLEKFSNKTGISVNLVTGGADALVKRLETEGRNSPADILITTDAGRLHRAQSLGLLQPIESKKINKAVPEHLREPNNHWIGLSMRARPIFYVKGKVDPSELSSYEALTDPKWKKRICIRSSDNIYNQSLVASMIATTGEAATENWAKGFVANFARRPQGGDRDQIKAAAAGMCDIVIANTYYFGAMLTGNDPAQKAAADKLAVFWPNQADRGTHVNISGAGVTAAAKNRKNAIKLLEYLVSKNAQKWYAEVNQEYPVRAGVKSSKILKGLGKFTPDSVNLSELGKGNAAAVQLMDRAGWK